jgi:hypothetical protein
MEVVSRPDLSHSMSSTSSLLTRSRNMIAPSRSITATYCPALRGGRAADGLRLEKFIAARTTKILGGPLHECLPAYASGINLHMSVDELMAQVSGWLSDGFRAFKVKVGKPDIEEDVERLIKIREVTGRHPLMVDANQGWDLQTATEHLVDVQNERSTRLGSAAFAMRRLWRTAL